MIAVLFEVEPQDGRTDQYLQIAAGLAEELRGIDGFIAVERFQSLSVPSKLLSLSFWRDEDAVRQWRNRPAHRGAQQVGRGGLFRGYRLRVAQVLRDYGLDERAEAPADSREAHPMHPMHHAHDAAR